MSDLQSQISLLNNYIQTLQRQTQSKSTQIKTLTQQNQQMIIECESLRKNKKSSITSTSSTQKLENELKQLKSQHLTLQQYKNKVQSQLSMIGFKTTDSYVGKIREFQSQVGQIIEKVKLYQNKIVEDQRKITLLTNQLAFKTSQIQRLNQKIKSINQIHQHNSHQNNQYNTKINQFQSKVTQYQTRIMSLTSQVTFKRSQVQRLQQKIHQFSTYQRQNQNIKRQNQKIIRENQSLKRQSQSLSLRLSSQSTSSSQISSLQSSISIMRSQQKEWQMQKHQLQINIQNLQQQIAQKANTIAQLRLRQDFLKNKNQETNNHSYQREAQSLNQTIRNLRSQVDTYKREITGLQQTNRSLDTQVSSFQYSKTSEVSNIRKLVQQKNSQINRLIQTHNQKVSQLMMEIQRVKHVSSLTAQSNNQLLSLREENTFLKRQGHNNTSLIQELQRDRQNLKLRINELEDQLSKARAQSNAVNSETRKPIYQNGDNQLKSIVKQLRTELSQVKKSNAVIHDENHQMQRYLSDLSESQLQIPYFGNESSAMRYHSPQNHINYQVLQNQSRLQQNESSIYMKQNRQINGHFFKSQVNIQRKRQQRVQKSSHLSPVRDVNNTNNKQKWESLQRKISALRVENDQLKKTLLYD